MNKSFVVYAKKNADLEPLLEKINTCHNNPEKSSATKINIQLLAILCLNIVHLMNQKINLIIIDCMKDFCKDLREHVMKIINHEKKKMMPLLYQKKKI